MMVAAVPIDDVAYLDPIVEVVVRVAVLVVVVLPLEVDLGRGVSARRIKLFFDPEGPAPELFALLLSTGEHAVDAGADRLRGVLDDRDAA